MVLQAGARKCQAQHRERFAREIVVGLCVEVLKWRRYRIL